MANTRGDTHNLDPVTRKIVHEWIKRERYDGIPWNPRSKPLAGCKVSIVSSAAVVEKGDTPFDREGEKRNPWWGDPTHRVLPADILAGDVDIDHMHIDTRPAMRDLNCVLPLGPLADLQKDGVVGEVAKHHYSIMGFILKTERLLEETAPKIVEALKADEVDLALLVPV